MNDVHAELVYFLGCRENAISARECKTCAGLKVQNEQKTDDTLNTS